MWYYCTDPSCWKNGSSSLSSTSSFTVALPSPLGRDPSSRCSTEFCQHRTRPATHNVSYTHLSWAHKQTCPPSYFTSPSGRRPGHQHWSCSDYAQSRHNYRYLYLLRALENCETVDGCSSACIRWIPKTGCYNGQGINIQQLPASEQAIQSWCTEYNKRPFHLLFFRRILTLSILTNRQICSYMKWDCHQPLAELWQIKTLVGRSIFTHAETYSSRGSTPATETRFRLWHGDVK